MKKQIKILSTATALFSIGVSAIASVALVNSALSLKSTTITNTDNTKKMIKVLWFRFKQMDKMQIYLQMLAQ